MKRINFIILLIAILFSQKSFSDIINTNSHYVKVCVKITNIDDFPDISLVGFTVGPMKYNPYIVSPITCLSKGYKFNNFMVYAVRKEYLKDKEIKNINFSTNVNALKSNITIEPTSFQIDNNNPLIELEQYYKIIGFTEYFVVLHKWKEIETFNNGTPNSIKLFEYNGNQSNVMQKMPNSVNVINENPIIEIFPNSTPRSYHLRIICSYIGMVKVDVASSSGKIVKSLNIDKYGLISDSEMDFKELAKGEYFVTIKIDKRIETKKILVL